MGLLSALAAATPALRRLRVAGPHPTKSTRKRRAVSSGSLCCGGKTGAVRQPIGDGVCIKSSEDEMLQLRR
jgi:hypothetical protein